MTPRQVFADIVSEALAEAVEREVKVAYRNGYRDAAAAYGNPLEAVQRAYAEADLKSEVYAAELAEDQ
jgi:hypothetical protein